MSDENLNDFDTKKKQRAITFRSTSTVDLSNRENTINHKPRSSTSLANRVRSVSGFEAKHYYSNKAIYYNSSTNLAFKRKYTAFQYRSKSTLNVPQRSISRISVYKAKTPLGKNFKGNDDDQDDDEDDDDDDEDAKPNRSFFSLLRMGLVCFGLETMFGLQEALTVPLLLKLKVPEQVYSFVYLLSPIIGFLVGPILGTMSDRCQSRFGRRRPFIFILAIATLIGISFILNSYELGQILGDKYTQVARIGIILTCIGVTILNFATDSCDTSVRALLIDSCNTNDQDTGLNIHAFLTGTGCATGFILGAIKWEKTFFRFIGSETQVVYIFAVFILVSSLIITLTSVKETPLVLKDVEETPLLKKSDHITSLPDDDNIKDDESSQHDISEDNDDESEDEVEESDEPITFRLLFKSLMNMPKELVRLLVCNTLGWMAVFSACLFFTDFIAQSIYHGSPSAPTNSTSFQNYDEGVKMGCWCLLSYSLVSAFYAIILEKFLISRFSSRALYFFPHLIYGICMWLVYFQNKMYYIMPLMSTLGLIVTVNSTLPYQLIAEFHQNKIYRSTSPPGTKRGLGIDCSLLSSVYFLAQTIVAAFMSLITSTFGNNAIVLVSALISLLQCFWTAVFLIYPESMETNDEKKRKNQLINKS